MTSAASSAQLALRSAFKTRFDGAAMPRAIRRLRLRGATGNPCPMTPPTKSGDDQTIEVQYTLEDEVLIVEHLDHSPEDFGESLARTLEAPGPAEGERELEAGLGGTGASIQRVSRRPR